MFGSLVTVELTRTNALVSVSGALGEPASVDPFARLSPFDARRAQELRTAARDRIAESFGAIGIAGT